MAHPSHLLLLEDEALVSAIWREELELAGYRVSAVERADSAFTILSSQAVHGVIADIGLPGMKGDQVASACRVKYPAIPVVLVTGFDATPYRELESDSMICVLQKPLVAKALLDCLSRVIPSVRKAPVSSLSASTWTSRSTVTTRSS